jgi:hypothetical protein
MHSDRPKVLKGDYEIELIDRDIALAFNNLHHRRKGLPAVVWAYGLFKGRKLLGSVVLSSPTSPAIAELFREEDPGDKIVQLTRLILPEGSPTNAGSFLISKSLKLFSKAHPSYTLAVTYCEANLYLGTVYKASNWQFHGFTTPGGYDGFNWNEIFVYPKSGKKNLKKDSGLLVVKRSQKLRLVYRLKKTRKIIAEKKSA